MAYEENQTRKAPEVSPGILDEPFKQPIGQTRMPSPFRKAKSPSAVRTIMIASFSMFRTSKCASFLTQLGIRLNDKPVAGPKWRVCA